MLLPPILEQISVSQARIDLHRLMDRLGGGPIVIKSRDKDRPNAVLLSAEDFLKLLAAADLPKAPVLTPEEKKILDTIS